MNTTNNKWYTSIWGIIILMYLFFPIGLYFLYVRLEQKHGKYYSITKILYWVGIICSVIGIFYEIIVISVSLTEYSLTEYLPIIILFLLMFVIPGLIMFGIGNKRNNKIKKYNRYLKYITVRKNIEIDKLCINLNENYDTVIKAIEEMISLEFINGYIEDGELIINNVDPHYMQKNTTPEERKVIKCKECGAKNSVTTGKRKECEYCGTILQ